MGHPSDLGLRSAVVSVGLARKLSLPIGAMRDVFHLLCEVKEGRLCPEAVTAVLAAAGHAVKPQWRWSSR